MFVMLLDDCVFCSGAKWFELWLCVPLNVTWLVTLAPFTALRGGRRTRC
jgi:hypothetical protein